MSSFQKTVLGVIAVGVLLHAPLSYGSEIKELKTLVLEEPRSLTKRWNYDRILCVDGLKVFQSLAFGAGNGSGAAISNVQLYEEKDGKVVPVRCE